MTTTTPRMRPIRTKLTAAAAAAALLTTAGTASASAAAAPSRTSSAALRAALHRDLTRYLTARRTAEHISADSLRVTFPGSKPAITLAGPSYVDASGTAEQPLAVFSKPDIHIPATRELPCSCT